MAQTKDHSPQILVVWMPWKSVRAEKNLHVLSLSLGLHCCQRKARGRKQAES